ncbi:MAG: arylsulfatase [Pseudomonadota bacterium]
MRIHTQRTAMPRIGLAVLMIALAGAITNLNSAFAQSETGSPPNVIIIIADDMGYSDIGVLGSEIETPNIDRLTREGTVFTRFYTAPTCSPTRAMLMTGVDNHLVGLGNMAETLDPAQMGQPGYEGYLNTSAANMAEVFGAAGYQTYITGKWHLGTEYEQSAFARGFDKTFVLLGGGASHFSDRIGQDVYRREAFYRRNGELVDTLPETFFSSDYFTTSLIEFIAEGEPDRPFLGYLNFTAPHWPLQAPEADILAQEGNYAVGYDVIRDRRFRALKDAGLIDRDAVQPPGTARAWDTLPDYERARSERVMEVYAAMIQNMDANIGKLITSLEANGHLENTVIIFMSDNGADGLEFDAIGAAFGEWTASFDNSLENIGREGSFVAYGRGWAHTGEAPHLGFKGLMSEGGIRSPMIMFAPMVTGPRAAGQLANYAHTTTVRDILPTLMDIAGIPDHGASFDGRDVLPITGTSLRSAMVQPDMPVHAGRALGAELWNQKSIIEDQWKLVQFPEPRGDGTWKLYNLANDLGERTDLAVQHPDVFERLRAAYEIYAEENNVIAPRDPFRLIEPERPAPLR